MYHVAVFTTCYHIADWHSLSIIQNHSLVDDIAWSDSRREGWPTVAAHNLFHWKLLVNFARMERTRLLFCLVISYLSA